MERGLGSGPEMDAVLGAVESLSRAEQQRRLTGRGL